MEETKVYFNAGDVVLLKLDIPNKPKMVVIEKVVFTFKHDLPQLINRKSVLRGIKCMWFTTDGYYLENIFNTKDLKLIKSKIRED